MPPPCENHEGTWNNVVLALTVVSCVLLIVAVVAVYIAARLWRRLRKVKEDEWENDEDEVSSEKEVKKWNYEKEASSLTEMGKSKQLSPFMDLSASQTSRTHEEQEQTFNFYLDNKSLGINTVTRRSHAYDQQMQKMQQLFQALVDDQDDLNMSLPRNFDSEKTNDDLSSSQRIKENSVDIKSPLPVSLQPTKNKVAVLKSSNPEVTLMEESHSEVNSTVISLSGSIIKNGVLNEAFEIVDESNVPSVGNVESHVSSEEKNKSNIPLETNIKSNVPSQRNQIDVLSHGDKSYLTLGRDKKNILLDDDKSNVLLVGFKSDVHSLRDKSNVPVKGEKNYVSFPEHKSDVPSEGNRIDVPLGGYKSNVPSEEDKRDIRLEEEDKNHIPSQEDNNQVLSKGGNSKVLPAGDRFNLSSERDNKSDVPLEEEEEIGVPTDGDELTHF